MFSALWRILPGRWWWKSLAALFIAGLAVYFLFTWAFPLVDGFVYPVDVTVEQ